MKLGEWIKQERERRGWSARELARRSNVSSATITRIENGDRLGRGDTLMMVTGALGLDPERVQRLLAGEPDTGAVQPERPLEDIVAELQAAIRRDRDRHHKAGGGTLEPVSGRVVTYKVQPQRLSADTSLSAYEADDISFLVPEDADPERYEVFRVTGDCLRGRIEPGHLVLVDKEASARPGDVVAVRNGELMVKILERRADGDYLIATDDRPSILVTDETHILGVVVQVAYTP